MFKPRPENCIDFYKWFHHDQYPLNTKRIFANFTPRSGKNFITPTDYYVNFGLQAFIKGFLIDLWNENFFWVNRAKLEARITRRYESATGNIKCLARLMQLHELGYLPLTIRALPEGTRVPIRVPCFVHYNNNDDFFWLTNYLETLVSQENWHPITSATIADHYKKLLLKHSNITGSPIQALQWQGHDFSARGMSGVFSSAASGAGHLLSFTGTDTVSAIDWLEDFYGANCETELIGASVEATEHSVMQAGGQNAEFETFERIIDNLPPDAIGAIVSDTWNIWQVLTDFLPRLKNKILARTGKIVIRPDSGDPVKIICGNDNPKPGPAWQMEAERKGVVQCLWDVFQGSATDKGYKLLDPHIGAIYGDSITIDRADAILSKLETMNFASSNVVLGIGSFTYQHVTRDSLGTAIKSTHAIVGDEQRAIFKDPITDNGTKKSAKGLLRVVKKNGTLVIEDELPSYEDLDINNEMVKVFENSELLVDDSLATIRNRLSN